MRIRHLAMMSAVVAVIGLAFVPAPAAATPANPSAVVLFERPIAVAGTFVMGLVKIVHNEEAMAKGEPCTEIYRVVDGVATEKITAVHCKRVSRPLAQQFTLALRTTDPTYRILTAYQFSGTDFAHEIVDAR